jgi:uncharacterized repeat protein (TIGR03803 family)
MRISMRTFVAGSLGAGLLVACGGGSNGLTSSTPLAVPDTLPRSLRSQPSHRVLTNVAGTLYGTTSSGGSHGEGTVYLITPSGGEAVLYSFSGTPDGAGPVAGLVALNGTLYGTTYGGGSQNDGTIYSITPGGAETVLHNFVSGGNDGAYPAGGLINVGGTLYGTTVYGGGSQNEGTVFKMATDGTYTQLHNFVGGGNDGAYPEAGLVNVGGTLYGTTYQGGGSTACYPPIGCGTVFKMATDGAYTQLHEFISGGNDGAYPVAGLINVGGTLYGTTVYGGGSQNEGTVFKMATDGTYTQLHNFVGGGNDGAYPEAGLVNVGGTLYGTTYQGGGSQNEGTVFKMATNGAYTQLHNFVGGGSDGAYPVAGLINVGGTLYGTTTEGGGTGCGFGYGKGCGVVFKMATNGAYTQLHNFGAGGNDGTVPRAALWAAPVLTPEPAGIEPSSRRR